MVAGTDIWYSWWLANMAKQGQWWQNQWNKNKQNNEKQDNKQYMTKLRQSQQDNENQKSQQEDKQPQIKVWKWKEVQERVGKAAEQQKNLSEKWVDNQTWFDFSWIVWKWAQTVKQAAETFDQAFGISEFSKELRGKWKWPVSNVVNNVKPYENYKWITRWEAQVIIDEMKNEWITAEDDEEKKLERFKELAAQRVADKEAKWNKTAWSKWKPTEKEEDKQEKQEPSSFINSAWDFIWEFWEELSETWNATIASSLWYLDWVSKLWQTVLWKPMRAVAQWTVWLTADAINGLRGVEWVDVKIDVENSQPAFVKNIKEENPYKFGLWQFLWKTSWSAFINPLTYMSWPLGTWIASKMWVKWMAKMMWFWGAEWAVDSMIMSMVDNWELDWGEVWGWTIFGMWFPFLSKWFSSLKYKIAWNLWDDLWKILKPWKAWKTKKKDYDEYIDKAKDAVTEIANNKNNLELTNEYWQTIKWQLPENIDQFGDAVEQTKKNIWKQVDNMLQNAEWKWIKINMWDIADDIEWQITEVIEEQRPELADMIRDKVSKLRTAGGEGKEYSVEKAEEYKQLLNKELQDYYRNKSDKKFQEATIDAMINNNLTKKLDDAIQSLPESESFKNLKRKHWALQEIEKDVWNRVLKEWTTKNTSLIDMWTIFSVGDIVKWVSGDPYALWAWLAQLWTQSRLKMLDDVNRQTRKMFKKAKKNADKLDKKPTESWKQKVKNKLSELWRKFAEEFGEWWWFWNKKAALDFWALTKWKPAVQWREQQINTVWELLTETNKSSDNPLYNVADMTIDNAISKSNYWNEVKKAINELEKSWNYDTIRKINSSDETVKRAKNVINDITNTAQNLSTKFLDDLQSETSKSVISKNTIKNKLNQKGYKKPELDAVKNVLDEFEWDKINVDEFVSKTKNELLPLWQIKTSKHAEVNWLHENVNNYEDLIEENYTNVYKTPFKHDVPNHFDNETKNYFAHTRAEDINKDWMKIRKLLEVQSDLFQQKKYEKVQQQLEEIWIDASDSKIAKALDDYADKWHERVLKEEIKKAGKEWKDYIDIPNGKTVAQIEWYFWEWLIPQNATIGDAVNPDNLWLAMDDMEWIVVEDMWNSARVVNWENIVRFNPEEHVINLRMGFNASDNLEKWLKEILPSWNIDNNRISQKLQEVNSELWNKYQQYANQNPDDKVDDILSKAYNDIEDEWIENIEKIKEQLRDKILDDYDKNMMVESIKSKWWDAVLLEDKNEIIASFEWKFNELWEVLNKTTEDNINMQSLPKEYKTVVDFYENKIIPYMKKQKQGAQMVEDDATWSEWLRVPISKEDAKKPVSAFELLWPTAWWVWGAATAKETLDTDKKDNASKKR